MIAQQVHSVTTLTQILTTINIYVLYLFLHNSKVYRNLIDFIQISKVYADDHRIILGYNIAGVPQQLSITLLENQGDLKATD